MRDGLGAHIYGRAQEIAALAEFPAQRWRALVLAGGAGIGKTTLWEVGLEVAREAGARVLIARAGDGEAHLSLTGLADLFDGVDVERLDGVPAPQRRALGVALLRREGAEMPEHRAVAAGLLSALRALAAAGPLVVAVDDAHWLDRDSAAALGFAARRLTEHPVRFLLTARGPAALEGAFSMAERHRILVGPLSLDATRRLLAARLDLALPRRVLRRVYDAAQGNPLFALELGRELAERGLPQIGEELALPASLDELLGARIDRLAAPQRRLLLAIALGADLRRTQLEAIAGDGAVEEALDAGLLHASGDRLRAAHPLLAAAAGRRSRPRERRALHRDLAQTATDEQQRVLHLAAGGMANQEIARTLFVTVHTVEAHLSRTYAKLGVPSRTQLPRQAS